MSPRTHTRPGVRGLEHRGPMRHRLPVTTALTAGRERLAKLVYARRFQLGFRTQQLLADAAGVSRTMIGRVERGLNVGRKIHTALELALQWEPGSCQAILDGGNPTIARPQNDSQDAPPELGDELRRDLVTLRLAMGSEEFYRFVEGLAQTKVTE